MPHRVTGLKLTQTNLHFLGVKIEAIVGPTLLELGHSVAKDASSHIDRTKGEGVHLADDIKVGPIEHRGHTVFVKVGPSKRTSWRAKFLEWGTVHMTARPFLRPARDKHKRAVKDTIKKNAAAAAKL